MITRITGMVNRVLDEEIRLLLGNPMPTILHKPAANILCNTAQRFEALSAATKALVATEREHRHLQLAVAR